MVSGVQIGLVVNGKGRIDICLVNRIATRSGGQLFLPKLAGDRPGRDLPHPAGLAEPARQARGSGPREWQKGRTVAKKCGRPAPGEHPLSPGRRRAWGAKIGNPEAETGTQAETLSRAHPLSPEDSSSEEREEAAVLVLLRELGEAGALHQREAGNREAARRWLQHGATVAGLREVFMASLRRAKPPASSTSSREMAPARHPWAAGWPVKSRMPTRRGAPTSPRAAAPSNAPPYVPPDAVNVSGICTLSWFIPAHAGNASRSIAT